MPRTLGAGPRNSVLHCLLVIASVHGRAKKTSWVYDALHLMGQQRTKATQGNPRDQYGSLLLLLSFRACRLMLSQNAE